MKKLIQICSLLTLVVAFSVVSAKAQTVQRMEADIPFSFNIGSKSYDAGTYVMRLASTPASGKVVWLEDSEHRVLQQFFIMERGDAAAKNPYLRFFRNDDTLTLAKIATPEKSFALPGVNFKSKVTRHYKPSTSDGQTVSVNLKLK